MLYELVIETVTGKILIFQGNDCYTEQHDDQIIYYIAGQSFPAKIVKQVNVVYTDGTKKEVLN